MKGNLFAGLWCNVSGDIEYLCDNLIHRCKNEGLEVGQPSAEQFVSDHRVMISAHLARLLMAIFMHFQ